MKPLSIDDTKETKNESSTSRMGNSTNSGTSRTRDESSESEYSDNEYESFPTTPTLSPETSSATSSTKFFEDHRDYYEDTKFFDEKNEEWITASQHPDYGRYMQSPTYHTQTYFQFLGWNPNPPTLPPEPPSCGQMIIDQCKWLLSRCCL